MRKVDDTPATLRAFALLEAVAAAERPVSLAEAMQTVALPKPTVYRLFAQLEKAGLLAREPGTRRYTVGGRLARLGRNVMLHSTVRAARHAVLQRLVESVGETCNLTMLEGAEVVYLDRVESAWPLRISLSPGSHVPLHCSASGKLLLALMPKAKRERVIASLAFAAHTPSTITEQGLFETALAEVRAQRFATDDEEYLAGLVCVAVPVVDAKGRSSAAVAVQAPAARMPLATALTHLPALRRAAQAMAPMFSD